MDTTLIDIDPVRNVMIGDAMYHLDRAQTVAGDEFQYEMNAARMSLDGAVSYTKSKDAFEDFLARN